MVDSQPVQREVLQGRRAQMMDAYIQMRCNLNYVPENDSEGDSWAQKSNQPENDPDLIGEGIDLAELRN